MRQPYNPSLLSLFRSNDANRQGFERTMDEVNAALSEQEGPYFLDDFSLVDCVFAPFLERIGVHAFLNMRFLLSTEVS